MSDIKMDGFKEIVGKYPQHAERIVEAFNAVLLEPDRDLEAELSGLGIDEEDIFTLADSVLEARTADIEAKNKFADDWGNHQKEMHFLPRRDKAAREQAAEQIEDEKSHLYSDPLMFPEFN